MLETLKKILKGWSLMRLFQRSLSEPTGFEVHRSRVEVILSWNKVQGASRYHVYRDDVLIASVDRRLYTDMIPLTQRSCYQIRAVDEWDTEHSHSTKVVLRGFQHQPLRVGEEE